MLTQVLCPDEDDIVRATVESLEARLAFGSRRLYLGHFPFQRSLDIFFFFFTAAPGIIWRLLKKKAELLLIMHETC